mgnify:CR=1 FL=1
MLGSGCCRKIFSRTNTALLFFLVWQLLLLSPWSAPLFAEQGEPIKIGVLAKRGEEQAIKKWSATATYLTEALPDTSFVIIPLAFAELRRAVADRRIDFVITNSSYYVQLEHEYGLSRIATLKNSVNGASEKRFGGVIFSRADNSRIKSFTDLVNSDFAAVNRDSFGGWQMAWREFASRGISPERDFASLTFSGDHDKVVYAVLNGKADAGTVRTDTLERMAAEGKISLTDIKLIALPGLSVSFPYLCSTRLYPEWPIAKLKETPDSLAERLSVALLSMPGETEAARAANIAGWTIPLDYQPVHKLMQELDIGPYQSPLGTTTLLDFYRDNTLSVILIVTLIILLITGLSVAFHLNHKLRRAQRELAKQLANMKSAERNYREIFDRTSEAIFVHDINNGTIVDINQAATTIYGYTPEEAREITMSDISSGEYPYNKEEAMRVITQACQENGKIFEWHARKKDNSLFWAEVNLQPAYIGGKQRLLAVIHDITARKQAENELQRYRHHLEEMIRERTADLIKSEAGLAEAQRLAHLGSWEWQLENDILWWSNETFHIFGLDPEDAPADHSTFMAAVHPDDRPKLQQAIDLALEKKQKYNSEHRIIRPDGSQRIVQEYGKVFYDPTGIAQRMVGTTQDITERKEIENEQRTLRIQLTQAQKLEAIGTMASGIAHDFNNILGAISGYTELAIMKSQENSKIVELLNQVLEAGKRARDLVQQILTFSRKDKLHRQPLILADIVDDSLKLLRATIPSNIDLQAKITATDSKIMADPTQIHQVVLNLCTNAHHAMELQQEGILHVEVADAKLNSNEAAAKNLAAGSYVRLTVSDTGSGISPEHLERIFEPFFTTKDQGKGTGMGLSVVHGIVKSCEGGIFAHSKKGEGSTFTIYFPRLSDSVPIKSKESNGPLIPQGHARILFVDDEPTLVELGQLILAHLGYQVTAVNSSLEALEILQQRPEDFDLLITDQSMPKMTGCQLAKEAIAIRADLPIILCSGYGSLMTPEEAKTLGIRKFIRKPYNTAVIAAAVQETLKPAD